MNNLIEKLTYYGAINEAGMEDTPTKRCMREAAVELHRLQVELISVLNTLPTQREWVGLTDEEFNSMGFEYIYRLDYARAVADLLKERNT
jgi:hypothetical protein